MKYVAVCVLSVLTMLTASASPSATQLFLPTLVAPAVHAANEVRDVVEGAANAVPDTPLMFLLGSALIALQLRRRQKSLRGPRLAIVSS